MLGVFRALALLATTPLMAGAAAPFATAHHAVSTEIDVAQQYFDRGLTLYYAYNGTEGIPFFERAAAADPHLALAYYGVALAAGPDLNTPLTEAHFKRAQSALLKARALESYASEPERAYIDALSLRYAHEFKRHQSDESQYRRAMAALVVRYPGDDDALTLYTEALLENSGREKLWRADSAPATAEVAIMSDNLRRVLDRTPNHIGANHLMIHLFDSAPDARAALPSARRLARMSFAPAQEHLAHMPAHTFIETGNYREAASASREAVRLFDAYLASDHNLEHENYWAHDVTVGVTALRMLGNYHNALVLSRRLDEHFGSVDASALTMLRFHRWDEILALHPAENSNALHFARGMSFAALGNVSAAERELLAFKNAKTDGPSYDLLAAKILIVRKEYSLAEPLLRQAVSQDQGLGSGENPYFYPPAEALGGLLFQMGRLDKAEAEFRGALGSHPYDPRALYGLSKTLEVEKKREDARATARQFQASWSGDDTALEMKEL
ncbi:MAG: hypothetical protein M3Z14_01015 [Candidatus Eremiobacteraeota bacterium]|nr:hypothetical protein [Candidatus Eremiobacteraeota bacterium]